MAHGLPMAHGPHKVLFFGSVDREAMHAQNRRLFKCVLVLSRQMGDGGLAPGSWDGLEGRSNIKLWQIMCAAQSDYRAWVGNSK